MQAILNLLLFLAGQAGVHKLFSTGAARSVGSALGGTAARAGSKLASSIPQVGTAAQSVAKFAGGKSLPSRFVGGIPGFAKNAGIVGSGVLAGGAVADRFADPLARGLGFGEDASTDISQIDLARFQVPTEQVNQRNFLQGLESEAQLRDALALLGVDFDELMSLMPQQSRVPVI